MDSSKTTPAAGPADIKLEVIFYIPSHCVSLSSFQNQYKKFMLPKTQQLFDVLEGLSYVQYWSE